MLSVALFCSLLMQSPSQSAAPPMPAGIPGVAVYTVTCDETVEVTAEASAQLSNPLETLEAEAEIRSASGIQHVPLFWDGGKLWKFRYSAHTPGLYSYQIRCTQGQDKRLGSAHGTIRIDLPPHNRPPQTDLAKHGAIRIAADHRHFEHADGTPFLWLADTWWKCLSSRLSDTDFALLTADRHRKGFSVVQIVCGSYPDEEILDPRMHNRGGMPYTNRTFACPNPAYFTDVDLRFKMLQKADIVPAIVGGWGRGGSLEALGLPAYRRHWRNLIARYGASPVIWIIGGEAGGPGWTEVAKYVRQTDPFHRPITIHPGSSARSAVTDESAIDFDMLQTGHGDWKAALGAHPQLTAALARQPAMPVLIGEACYEGHMQSAFQDVERWLFWSSILSGAAGHTYGAAGIWHAGIEGDPGISPVYDWTTWKQGMHYPGSEQLGLARKLLLNYPFHRFEPHPEWSSADCFSAGIPGKLRFIYQPRRGVYDWGGTEIRGIEPEARYRLTYWDPATGRRFPAGSVRRAAANSASGIPMRGVPVYSQKDDTAPDTHWKDAGSVTIKVQGEITAPQKSITLCTLPSLPANRLMALQARSDAEAGIILKYKDPANYVVALYSPLLHALYIHERISGSWGAQLGRVDVPDAAPSIQLEAGIHGNRAFACLTTGSKKYITPTVSLKQAWGGPCGIWMFQVGESQHFTNIRIGTCPELPPPPPAGETVISGASFRTPGVPSPQDWVLIMERE